MGPCHTPGALNGDFTLLHIHALLNDLLQYSGNEKLIQTEFRWASLHGMQWTCTADCPTFLSNTLNYLTFQE